MRNILRLYEHYFSLFRHIHDTYRGINKLARRASRELLKKMAGTTGLEPAASAVTGQRSNQLNYVPGLITGLPNWWAVQDSNLRPPACKAGALTS